MKRFFFVFTIIMILFLVLAAGCVAAVELAGINALSNQPDKQPVFVGGWGITLLSFSGGMVVYPEGDLFVVKQVSSAEVKQGDIVLYAGGSKWYMRSGYIAAKTQTGFTITSSDGITAEEPAESVKALYYKRLPHLGKVLGDLESPLAIGVFAAVLLASIILWRVLPSAEKPSTGALSNSDGDIASILY